MSVRSSSLPSNLRWGEKFSAAETFVKQAFTQYLDITESWCFSSNISSLHIPSGPFCGQFKRFQVATAAISPWGVFEKERLEMHFSQSEVGAFFEDFKFLLLACGKYRIDAFLWSVWNAVIFLWDFLLEACAER